MIDNFSLLITTALIIFVVFRAVKLDKVLPWFEAEPNAETSKTPETAPASATRWRAARARKARS